MQSITIGGAALRYHDLPGSGPPLVFLHGLGCAASCDYPQIAALTGRRALLVDLLGAGFSDHPGDFGYTIEDHAAAVAALVARFPAVDVFGHSMGGSIAIAVATRCADRVARLVVSEPNLDPGGGAFSRGIAAASEAAFIAAGHAALIASARAAGNDLWAAGLTTWSAVAVHRAAASLVAGSAPTWRTQLATLRMPRTVLFGARSLPDPDTERLAAIGAAIRVVPDAGHSLMWENPAGVAAALREALP